MLRVFILVVTLAFILSCGEGGSSNIISPPVLATIYVDSSATGDNNGISWDNAFTDLQKGIDEAAKNVIDNKVVRIHVAVGTYKPSSWPNGGSSDREKHFALKNSVEIYGGYPKGGGDTPTADASETILNGDIGANKVYHVFYHPSSAGLTSSAKLENVTITNGNANGNNDHGNGGGMFNENSSPTLSKVIFTSNNGNLGGGMYNGNSNLSLSDITFTSNNASGGGGVYNLNTSSTLTRVIFRNNTSFYSGGGIYNKDSTITLTSCKFIDNIASYYIGGGIYNGASTLTLTDCRFTTNTAKESGGAIHSIASSTTNFINNALVATDAVSSRSNGYFQE